jgi:hypothetical protein
VAIARQLAPVTACRRVLHEGGLERPGSPGLRRAQLTSRSIRRHRESPVRPSAVFNGRCTPGEPLGRYPHPILDKGEKHSGPAPSSATEKAASGYQTDRLRRRLGCSQPSWVPRPGIDTGLPVDRDRLACRKGRFPLYQDGRDPSGSRTGRALAGLRAPRRYSGPRSSEVVAHRPERRAGAYRCAQWEWDLLEAR